MSRWIASGVALLTIFWLGWWMSRSSAPHATGHAGVRTRSGETPAAVGGDVVAAPAGVPVRSPLVVPIDRPVDPLAEESPQPHIAVASTPMKSQRQWRLELLEKELATFRSDPPNFGNSTRWGNAQMLITFSIAAIMDSAGTSQEDVPPFSPRTPRERYFSLNGRAYRFGVGEFAEFDALLGYVAEYSRYESRRITDPSAVEPRFPPNIVDLITARAEEARELLK